MYRQVCLRAYGRMPRRWIKDQRGLKYFKISYQYSFSALKIYLFLVCYEFPTYDDIENNTFVARVEIKPSLILLQEAKLITVTRDITGNIYSILGGVESWFAQVPTAIFNNSLLQHFTLKHSIIQQDQRRQTAIDALKLYYLFLAIRNDSDNRAMIGYDKIVDYTGIQRKNIRRSISLLIEIGLINCENSYYIADKKAIKKEYIPGSNRYFINYLEPYQPIEGWAPCVLDTKRGRTKTEQ